MYFESMDAKYIAVKAINGERNKSYEELVEILVLRCWTDNLHASKEFLKHDSVIDPRKKEALLHTLNVTINDSQCHPCALRERKGIYQESTVPFSEDSDFEKISAAEDDVQISEEDKQTVLLGSIGIAVAMSIGIMVARNRRSIFSRVQKGFRQFLVLLRTNT